MPYITQVAMASAASERVRQLYPHQTATSIRDYIHVVDLRRSCQSLEEWRRASLGSQPRTGGGYSVLDVVKAFEKASGKPVPYKIAPRRAGDIARTFADPAKANHELDWSAERGIDQMFADSWLWQQYATTLSKK
jgi:UDP-glucose 4-epimerase